MPLKPSALGDYLLVMPGHGCWQVACFSATGQWQASATGFISKGEAQARRQMLLRHHKKLAAERAKRAANRKQGAKR